MPRYQIMTENKQKVLTPGFALELLKAGNERFVQNDPVSKYFRSQIELTAAGQFPFAFVLSCIDSRVPVEIIFDLSIGDVFSGRIAGNFVNIDLLGSMEFACVLAGAKLILVMGHTSCGAIKGAVDGGAEGNLATMLEHFKPVIESVDKEHSFDEKTSANSAYVDLIGETNVRHTMEEIRKQSPALSSLEKSGEIMIVGGMYDVASGKVKFLEK